MTTVNTTASRLHALLLLLPAWLAMAWLISKAAWFWNNNPDLQFGWVVVLLCAYLFYEAWEARPAVHCRARWWAGLLGVAGLGCLFVLQIYQAAFGTNAASTLGTAMSVLLVVASNVGLVFGWNGIRTFGFPFAFLLIAMPMPSIIQGFVVNGLQNKVASINAEVLNLVGIPARQVGSLIHLPVGTVGIDEACSGIRSLQSTLMATLFIGYLTFKRVSFQIVLLFSGLLLAVGGNLARSFYLCLVANSKGLEALDKYHDSAGWSILAFTVVGVVVLSWLLKKLETAAERSRETSNGPTAVMAEEEE